MQNLNPAEQPKKMSREDFLQEAEKQLERVKADLGRLHGEPPCMYAIDIDTLKSWSETKREETLAVLRAVVSQAKTIVQEAENERAGLWERSDATEADRPMPPIVYFKSIREDLEAYEDVLNFVRSHE